MVWMIENDLVSPEHVPWGDDHTHQASRYNLHFFR
jgi:hypothetical protein